MPHVILYIGLIFLIYLSFRLFKYVSDLKNKVKKLEHFSEVLNKIEDKSYIVSVKNTLKPCKRCDTKEKQGLIYENRRFRFRVNEDSVWVNELPSYFYCTNCKYKSLTLKRLTKYSGNKIKNGD